MRTAVTNRFLLPALIPVVGVMLVGLVRAQTFTTLHRFPASSGSPATNSDGYAPEGVLLLSGNTLYGTAHNGGSSGEGTVFAVGLDGAGFTVLHSFTAISGSHATNSDGANPRAGLTLSGNTLYGTASGGGSSGNGTVFAVNTDGTGFTALHSFAALSNLTNNDGAAPHAVLLLSGNTLYGMAFGGGSSGSGTVFKVNTDGTDFTTLHSFAAVSDPLSTNSDGAYPDGGLILSGNTLYGTTYGGGSSADGTVFAVNTDGTSFATLHSFAGSDGIHVRAGLILSDNTLYGAAQHGGSWAAGTVFKLNTDGTGFATLHNFIGGDGLYPDAGLALSGNTLYGTTAGGGSSGNGTVFAVNTDGTGFTNLFDFSGGNGDVPLAGLILSDNKLYGAASAGGSSDNGTVFTVGTDGTGFTTLYVFTAASASPPTNSDGANPQAGLVLSGGTLYGTASEGGRSGYGTVFKVSTGGTGFTTLYSFTDGSDGANPQGGLTLLGQSLYGTAFNGGTSGYGTVFEVHTNGTGFTTLHSFGGYPGDGAHPRAGLVLSRGALYGVAAAGGGSGYGTVFKLSTGGRGFRTLHSFTGSDGAYPAAGLLLSGTTLYGAAYSGGSSGYGTVFKLNTDGTGFTPLHNFNGGSDGAYLWAVLTLSGDTLYGTALDGGSSGNGTLFKVGADGTAFTVLHSFDFSDGAVPRGGLVLSGGALYGTTRSGGGPGNGTVFEVNAEGTDLTTLYGFTSFIYANTNDDGATPDGALILSGNTLFGTASSGGISDAGTVFALQIQPPMITLEPVSQTVKAGGNVTLQAAATGVGTLTYQWRFDGGVLADGSHVSGATTGVLTLEKVTKANAGGYELVASSPHGSATSAVAFVTVLVPPVIMAQPRSQTVPSGGIAAFAVKATGAHLAYHWFFDDVPLSDNGIIFGSASNQLTINPVMATNVGSYFVVVSNAAAAVTSKVAQLHLTTSTPKP